MGFDLSPCAPNRAIKGQVFEFYIKDPLLLFEKKK